MPPRRVRIITDSSSQIPPSFAEKLEIAVLPLEIQLGRERFREGLDITSREFFRKLAKAGRTRRPKAFPPSLEAFNSAFAQLSRQGGDILALHLSSKLNPTYRVAREAANAFLGQSRIMVLDSQTTSLGLGHLVLAAAEGAAKGESLEEVVRIVRGMMPHLYLVLFVENLDYLEREKRIAKEHALLGTMLGIKPLFILEEGDIVPLEKARSRTKAVERLFEFLTEFPHIEKMTILHGADGSDLPELLERLETAYPDKLIDVVSYAPSLAAHVGPGALGVFVYEGMN
ncbi:MAG: DegV family protein [Chloroflexi bacterium]|nr:DegV family protein [Chloroflexota bacterium]